MYVHTYLRVLCIIRLTSVSLHNDFTFCVVENVREAKTGRQKRQQSLPRAKYATFYSHCLRVTISIDRFRTIDRKIITKKVRSSVLFYSFQSGGFLADEFYTWKRVDWNVFFQSVWGNTSLGRLRRLISCHLGRAMFDYHLFSTTTDMDTIVILTLNENIWSWEEGKEKEMDS